MNKTKKILLELSFLLFIFLIIYISLILVIKEKSTNLTQWIDDNPLSYYIIMVLIFLTSSYIAEKITNKIFMNKGTNENNDQPLNIGTSSNSVFNTNQNPSAFIVASSGTSSFNNWHAPVRIDVIENNDSIEFIYKQTSIIGYTSFPPPPPETMVFKIVFSCVNGKWNKSDRIYGKIIPASNETYEF